MDTIHLHYDVAGDDFISAGEASSDVKRTLRRLGFDTETIRRASICMYEGEINMVIHAYGGEVDVYITEEKLRIVLKDNGPGIPDIEKAMQEGYTTASQTVHDLGFGAGMGLPNMKRYSDEMEVESEEGVGTTVKMTIYTR
ncbi:anti-sigma regulatory factor [Oscillospiraceae bacterium OttesenSCG-928-G22]|nr:anti-sigma regulatory factor [Oscillospiraceae bacterium OttesenSCG-928-G22]